MARSLLRDMSKSELQGMRDNGMSNAEIAEALDVSYATVYAILGKQPAGLRSPRRDSVRGGEIVTTKAPEPEQEEAYACLVLQNKVIELEGLYAKYKLDIKGKQLHIDAAEIVGAVNLDKLGDLIAELTAIHRKLDTLKVGNEMW